MRKYCTYEQAIELRKLGLTQPHPEPGQVWYNEFGYVSEILELTPQVVITRTWSGKQTEARYSAFQKAYYAPTPEEATEMLKKLRPTPQNNTQGHLLLLWVKIQSKYDG